MAECLVTEIYDDSGFCLEYTPDGAEENEVICYNPGMLGVKEGDYDPEKKILLYKADCKDPQFVATVVEKRILFVLDLDYSVKMSLIKLEK